MLILSCNGAAEGILNYYILVCKLDGGCSSEIGDGLYAMGLYFFIFYILISSFLLLWFKLTSDFLKVFGLYLDLF